MQEILLISAIAMQQWASFPKGKSRCVCVQLRNKTKFYAVLLLPIFFFLVFFPDSTPLTSVDMVMDMDRGIDIWIWPGWSVHLSRHMLWNRMACGMWHGGTLHINAFGTRWLQHQHRRNYHSQSYNLSQHKLEGLYNLGKSRRMIHRTAFRGESHQLSVNRLF